MDSYLKDFPIVKNKPLTEGESFFKKALIVCGVAAAIYFLQWFLQPQLMGYKPLYILLLITFLSSVIGIFFEWYFTFQLRYTPKPELRRQWTVDVLTTYCAGEPKEMVINTLRAIQRIKYPHTTYLCDEENDEELRKICEELGVRHVTREKKVDAKAGNINAALTRYATGELCLIIDPDHVPHPDFFSDILPFFEDNQVAYVQTVQGYYNQHATVIAKAAAEQTYLFYGPIMMGLNHLGTTPAIGANCVFRRAALDSIGGHAAGTTEDMHTSMLLHAKGWKSVYEPSILSRGLVPWNFSGYMKQQLKWARGTFELIVNVLPKIFTKLSFHQKAYYISCGLFYGYGVKGFLDILISVLSLLLMRVPVKMDILSFFQHYLPFLFLIHIIRQFNQRWIPEENTRGVHFFGAILLKASWWIALIGLIYTIIRKKVPYIPTPKDNVHETPWKLFIPNLAAIALSAFAIWYGLKKDYHPYSLFMAGIALLNIFQLGLGTLMGMQTWIYGFHKTFPKSVFRKGSRFRRAVFTFRHVLYRRIQHAPVTFMVIALLISLGVNVVEIKSLFPTKSPEVYYGVFQGERFSSFISGKRNDAAVVSLEFNFDQLGDSVIEGKIKHILKCGKIPFLYIGMDYRSEKLTASLSGRIKPLIEIFHNNYASGFICIRRLPVHPEDEEAYFHAVRDFSALFAAHATGQMSWVWEFNGKTDKQFILDSERFVSWYMVNGQYDQETEPPSSRPTFYYNWRSDRLTQHLHKIKQTSLAFVLAEGETLTPRLASNQQPALAAMSMPDSIVRAVKKRRTAHQFQLPYIRGVAYNPGHDWQDDRFNIPLTARKLDRDFCLIREMGGNVIRRYSPGIYDYNILRAANNHGLKVIYGFWFDPNINYLEDEDALRKYRSEVIRHVNLNKGDSAILAWSVGNETWGLLKHRFGEPYLSMVRKAYVNFIQSLAEEIQSRDARPILTVMEHTPQLPTELSNYFHHAPAIDFVGVNSYYSQNLSALDSIVTRHFPTHPYLIGEFGPEGYWHESYTTREPSGDLYESTSYEKARQYKHNWEVHVAPHQGNNLGGIAFCWQDRFEGTATWFGLTDIHGYKKPAYYSLKEIWTGTEYKYTLPEPKVITKQTVLRPGKPHTLLAGTGSGHVLQNQQYKWIVYNMDTFEKILETDFRKKPSLTFTLPKKKAAYRVHLYVTENYQDVITTSSPLNIIWDE